MPAQKVVQRKKGQVYIANQSFVVSVDGNGRVTTDGSGITKEFHAGRTRVVEGDPILDHCDGLFDLLEDHDAPLV